MSFGVCARNMALRSMNRRQFLQSLTGTASLAAIVSGCSRGQAILGRGAVQALRRARPGDPAWPSQQHWDELKKEVGGYLIKVESPLAACRTDPNGASCSEFFSQLKNPYFIGDHPALTQTSGYADAWNSTPSAYAVAAKGTADIVAAVNFARDHNLRLVVKGGGHCYQGRSCSADSLLIWTRSMNSITLHDAFVPQGGAGKVMPYPAATVGAGALWVHAYDAVTTKAGRYVQGGGCTTVGVAGLIQNGGFGSFSKMYGLAAAGLLEAEVVTADGRVLTANAYTNADLFWALKGGGGGSFGVLTKLTLSHDVRRDVPNRGRSHLASVPGLGKGRPRELLRGGSSSRTGYPCPASMGRPIPEAALPGSYSVR